MNLTDTHIHLHFPQYDPDRPEVLRRAIAAGVRTFLNIGTDLENSRKAIALAEQYPEIYVAIGYHPNETHNAVLKDLEELEKLVSHPKVVAIGEIGLDYFHDHSPQEVQKELLRVFLGWYAKYQKPIIIHCRDAYVDLLSILQETAQAPFRGTLHCFSSDARTMKEFLALGFHVSFGGALTYKKNDALREACGVCPKDRLLLETDGPYLSPQSKRGQRNEPLYMVETAECAAKLHGVSVEELADMTTLNAKKLFSL